MTIENKNSNNQSPTVEEQQRRLNSILHNNMRIMLGDQAFFRQFKDKLKDIHGKSLDEIGNDTSISVSRSGYGKRTETGEWEEGEYFYAGTNSHTGNNVSTHSLVTVAKMLKTSSGDKIVPMEGFTDEQASMVAGLVGELLLAKVSGQIPDVHEYDLHRIYIPTPHREDDF